MIIQPFRPLRIRRNLSRLPHRGRMRHWSAVLFQRVKECVDPIGPLPCGHEVLSAHMTVSRKRGVLGIEQTQLADDRRGTAVKDLFDCRDDLLLGICRGTEGIRHDRYGMRDADRVRKLDLAFFRDLRGDNVLRDVSRVVRSRTVDLCRVFARESAAAVAGIAAVGIDDDLSAGQTSVAGRPADDKASGGIDKDLGIVVEQRRGDGRADDLFDDILAQGLEIDLVVLGRNDNGIDALDLVVVVLDGDLRFSVGTQIGDLAGFSSRGEFFGELVGERDRKGHQLLGLVAGKAKHHTLIARADDAQRVAVARAVLKGTINAHRDIGGLLVEHDIHLGSIAVEAVFVVVVADVTDRLARDRLDIDVAGRVDLADHAYVICRYGSLAGDMRIFVLL